MTFSKPRNSSFYLQSTTFLAKALLGKILVRTYPDKSEEYFRIVETEAYLGLKDPSCHSYGDRRTPRTEPMYLQGGACYVYQIYGLHFCLNIVSKKEGIPEAVLIRGLEPLNNTKRTNGPGILCKSLHIDKTFNGLFVFDTASPLRIYEGPLDDTERIARVPRIGLSHKEAKAWKLRFYIKNNPHISKP